MDPFVRRLVRRLNDPTRPLSRNRHFHTFETPEGKQALKVSRRLRALGRQIVACHAEGGGVRLHKAVDANGESRVELRLDRISGHCMAMLRDAELELLTELPGVAAALGAAEQPASDAG